ncbi:hypothetical protein GGR54DRAFT_606705 [Hypoxylon sp. NC1633]|nr:hypothetical protein GGR54DRAFT_606705 [Hypoxylon sp. NC1633]
MRFSISFTLSTFTSTFQARIRFTTNDWSVRPESALVLKWVNADGAVTIDLLKVATGEHWQTSRIAEDYTGRDTLMWTPDDNFVSGDCILRICDRSTTDESPTLSISGHFLQSVSVIQLRGPGGGDTSSEQASASYSLSVVTGVGVGCTLGGVLLLGLVALLIYRGRQGSSKRPAKSACH